MNSGADPVQTGLSGDIARESQGIGATAPDVSRIVDGSKEPLLRFFEYKHLPSPAQVVGEHFHALARHIANHVPRNAERTVALRKLLEAKDSAVRAVLPE